MAIETVRALENLAALLRTVPRESRDAVGRRLSAFAFAPDSAELLDDIKQLILNKDYDGQTSAQSTPFGTLH